MGFVGNALRHVFGGGGRPQYMVPPKLSAREIVGATDLRSKTPDEVTLGATDERRKRGRRQLTVQRQQQPNQGTGLNI